MGLDIDPTTQVNDSAWAWLRGLRFGPKVEDWIPGGYEAYARILHPFDLYETPESAERLVTWAEVSAWSGKTLLATSTTDMGLRSDGTRWDGRAYPVVSNFPHEGWLLSQPHVERLTGYLGAATGTPGFIWSLVWFGFGSALGNATRDAAFSVGDSLTRSGRKYVLRRARIVPSSPPGR